MAKYTAESANSYESSGGDSFRLQKDGDKARVVFLYAGPDSIDGWACHRFQRGQRGFTYTVDCPRSPKDPLDKCPACVDGHALYTRIMVRMLDLNTNKVTVWDRASSFRKDLLGFMEYFNPLYSKVYEITRRGSGLQTQYQYQSLNDSGITAEQYEEYVKQADEAAASYIRPIDQYQTILGQCKAAAEQEAQEGVQVDSGAAQGQAWGAPPQGQAWGQAPQAGGWGAPPRMAPAPTPQNGGWGAPNQAPQGPMTTGTPVQEPVQQISQAPQQPPQQWGQAPTGNWGQAPTGWGQQNG